MSHQNPDREEVAATGEPFLQRWSRRKSVARDAARADDDREPLASPAPAEPVAQPEEHPGGAPALPDLETLGPDSDYSAFLSPQVDAALRRTALRKLFHSPKFNVCDGLDDYCDDFTKFAPLGDIVTADMRHQIERAARELAERAARALPVGPTVADEPPQSRGLPEPMAPDPGDPPAADDEDDARHGPA